MSRVSPHLSWDSRLRYQLPRKNAGHFATGRSGDGKDSSIELVALEQSSKDTIRSPDKILYVAGLGRRISALNFQNETGKVVA